MKKVLIPLAIIVLLAAGYWYVRTYTSASLLPVFQNPTPKSADNQTQTTLATNLDTPWSLAFLPDKSILVTERPGRIRLIDSSAQLDPSPIANLSQVTEIGEGGLLGLAIDPDFTKTNYIYLYYTYSADKDNTLNRVVRMVYKGKKVSDEKTLIDKIPGAANHNGGRLKFGPDGLLYVTTGDAQEPSRAQDTKSLAGKILRVKSDGSKPADNPFDNLVYSYGHRNPQGLAWDSKGQLWSTEHGRSGAQSGLDELNMIQKGHNYGWPTIQGDQTKSGMETPKLNSGNTTWAPAGAAFIGDSIFFGGLRGKTLYEAVVKGIGVTLQEHSKELFGRIRDVVVGPDNMLYITTSNQDGRGVPNDSDDRVIRLNPQKLSS